MSAVSFSSLITITYNVSLVLFRGVWASHCAGGTASNVLAGLFLRTVTSEVVYWPDLCFCRLDVLLQCLHASLLGSSGARVLVAPRLSCAVYLSLICAYVPQSTPVMCPRDHVAALNNADVATPRIPHSC